MAGTHLTELVSRLCAGQRKRWQNGAPAWVESYLADHPELESDREALLDLIYGEISVREDLGDRPQLDEYLKRFPRLAEQLSPLFEVHRAVVEGQWSWSETKDGALEPETDRPGEATPPEAGGPAVPLLDPPQSPDEIGRFGPYRITRILGSGGMGIVLEASDPQLKRQVALKIMKPALAASRSARQRFLREARAAASIEHDHIVTIYCVGEQRDLPYLAMQRLRGESLAERIKRDGAIPPADVIRIGRQIAAGLAAAHERGVIHRDVKSENIWLEAAPKEDCVKILDFGLARVADDDVRLTHQGFVAGTPAYMAPEQAQDTPVDQRADLFSLGCVLYEMCTGQLPFTASTAPSMLLAVTRQRPPAPRQLHRDVPRPLSDLIMKLLEKDPSRRIQSARELLEALTRCAEAPGPRRGWARRRPLVVGMAAAALLLAAVTVRYAVSGEGTVVLQLTQSGVEIAVDDKHVDIRSQGGSAILMLPSGKHELRVSKHGFSPYIETVRVRRGKRTVLEIDLDPKGVILAERILRGHAGAVKGVAVSGDGRLALSGGEDMVLRLWEVKTGRLVRVFSGHEGTVRSVAFSPDDARALSASCDGTARLWSIRDGREIRRFEGHTAGLLCAAFSPDASRVLTGGFDATVRLWDTESGKLVKTLKGHTTWVRSVAFSPDGRYGLSGGNDAVALVWDLERGRLARVLQGHRHVVGQVAFCPDGRLAATGSWDNTIRLWDLDKETELCVLEDDEGGNRRLALVPGSRRLLSAGADHTVHLWDLSEGRRIARLAGHDDEIQSVAVSPDGRTALSAGADATVRVWRLPEAGQPAELRAEQFRAPPTLAASPPPLEEDETVESATELRRFQGHTAGVRCVAFSPEGTLALSGGEDGTARLWDVQRGQEIRQMDSHSGRVLSVVFSPDGSLVMSSGADGTVRLWDPTTGRQTACLEGHESWVSSAVFSPDGSRILSGSFDATLRLWDVPTRGELKVLSGPNAWVRGVAFLPDGRHVIAAGNFGSPIIWDTETGQRVGQLGEQMRIFVCSTVAVLPDGSRVAVGDWEGQVHVWDFKRQDKLLRGRAHAGTIRAVLFTPDGRHFVTAGGDNVARAWRTDDGTLACRLDGHAGEVTCLAVSSDGGLALTGSEDDTLRLWALPAFLGQLAGDTQTAIRPDND